jgi:ABC-type sugar transport system ATPase subunit
LLAAQQRAAGVELEQPSPARIGLDRLDRETGEDVSKRFGEVEALKNFSLEIEDGEFVVLVGPSGSGKTTALRLLAGLEAPTAGGIRVGDRVVNRVAPRDRDIAMVFQDYALYPQMTVFQNLAFELKMRKMPKEEIEQRVNRAADMLDIGELLQRKPPALSGGQRQRVALGRALVREPKAFLMDEPLSNLDAKLRVQTRSEIKHLQQQVHTTTVYVTHDQIEAMTMGDRVAVMRKGEHPANVFVAGFIGSPAMSFATMDVERGGGSLTLSRGEVVLNVPTSNPEMAIVPARVIVGVRPEHAHLWNETVRLVGPVNGCAEYVEMLGRETLIGVSSPADLRYTVFAPADAPVRPGDNVQFGLEPGRLYLFDVDSERALAVV